MPKRCLRNLAPKAAAKSSLGRAIAVAYPDGEACLEVGLALPRVGARLRRVRSPIDIRISALYLW
jgi:hypothetical protein